MDRMIRMVRIRKGMKWMKGIRKRDTHIGTNIDARAHQRVPRFADADDGGDRSADA